MGAEEPPAHQEEGKVKEDHPEADVDLRKEMVGDLGQAGDTAEADGVGLKAPVKSQGVKGTPQKDHGVIFQVLFSIGFHFLLLQQRHLLFSPVLRL